MTQLRAAQQCLACTRMPVRMMAAFIFYTTKHLLMHENELTTYKLAPRNHASGRCDRRSDPLDLNKGRALSSRPRCACWPYYICTKVLVKVDELDILLSVGELICFIFNHEALPCRSLGLSCCARRAMSSSNNTRTNVREVDWFTEK